MTLTAHEEKNNARINDELRTLYDEYTQEFLSAWSEAFNERHRAAGNFSLFRSWL